MKTDDRNTDVKKELHSIIDSLPDEQAGALLVDLVAEYGNIAGPSVRSKAGEQADAGKAMEELERIWRSKVKRGLTNDPHEYFHTLSGLMDKYVPVMIEAGKYSDAAGIIAKVYQMTDVCFYDDLYEDHREFVVEDCFEYWGQIAKQCGKSFKPVLKDSLKQLESMGRQNDCADEFLREFIDKDFAVS